VKPSSVRTFVFDFEIHITDRRATSILESQEACLSLQLASDSLSKAL
jgi:hypothetical protein